MIHVFRQIRTSLKARLLLWVWFTSSLATSLFISIQLYTDYKEEHNLALQQFQVIKDNYLPSLNKSMWDYNFNYINLQIQSLNNLPYVTHIALFAGQDEVYNSSEVWSEDDLQVATFKLDYQGEKIGELKAGLDIASIRDTYINKAVKILFAQSIKTFIVCYLLLLIFSKVIMRHILQTAKYLENFKLEDDNKLELKRGNVNDELSTLTNNINNLKEDLFESNQQLIRFSKTLEEKVKERTEELELERTKSIHAAKLASLGEMAGGIAHEINNPLAIISASMSLLKRLRELDKLEEKNFTEIYSTIDRTLKRISKIIAGLRVVSRDTGEFSRSHVKVGTIFDDVLGLCSEKFKNHGVALQIEINKDQELFCDRVQISQVLINLIGNAYDVAVEQPEKWVKIIQEEDEENDIIRIIDSGRNIPEEIVDKMFNPFFTTKEIGKGTGLGLSISRTIILKHKGTLDVDRSYLNTCFVIKIPKYNAKEQITQSA